MDSSKITTDPELTRRLKMAAGKKMSVSEIEAQKASFVWGQLPHDHPMSKDEVSAHLSGFAPYTPVKVSSKTTPLETERQAHERRLRELSEPPYGTKVTINQKPLDYWQTPSK